MYVIYYLSIYLYIDIETELSCGTYIVSPANH